MPGRPESRDAPAAGSRRSGRSDPAWSCRPARGRCPRRRLRRSPLPPPRPGTRDRSSSRSRPQYAAARCRSACGSTRRTYRPSSRGRNSSESVPGDTSRCPLCANTFCWLVSDDVADLLGNAFAGLDDRRADGGLERELVRAAVALQDDAVQADEARAVVAARVHALADRVERRLRDQPLQRAQRAAMKLLLQERADQAGDAFHRLQRDVADEAVRDDDVDLRVKNAVALDEAD